MTPGHLVGGLHELRVLNHHRVDDAEEGLVTREETGPAGQGVTLEHALAGVLGQDLDDTTAVLTGGDIPLEVTATMTEDRIELVGDELIGREDTEG